MNSTTTLHLDAFGVTSVENSALAAVSGGTAIPEWLKRAGEKLVECIVKEADAIVEGFRDGFNDGAQS